MTDIDDIREPDQEPRRGVLSRRRLIAGGGALVLAGAAARYSGEAKPEKQTAAGPRKLRLAWNANAVCLAPVVLAQQYGLFKRNGLDVELVNFAGSTDQLLEAMSTGKAEAGIGMIMRWIKPLEQGFDVKLIAGTHGGCIRMSGSRSAGITRDPRSLKGKTIGLSEISGAGRNTFAVLLKYHGLDPDRDVEWRAYPQPLLGEAIRKGEVHAIADSDPILYILEKESKGDLVEVLSNLTAPWQNRVCCVVGTSGALLRETPETARSLALALTQAASLCSQDPYATARAYAPYAKASVEDLVAVLRSQTHSIHPSGKALKADVVRYATELRDIGVLRPSTDPVTFAGQIISEVLA